MTKQEYSKLLKTDEWKLKREEILKRDQYECINCKSVKNLHVHHTYYENEKIPWEYPDDALVTLCRSCHTKTHKFFYRIESFYNWVVCLPDTIILSDLQNVNDVYEIGQFKFGTFDDYDDRLHFFIQQYNGIIYAHEIDFTIDENKEYFPHFNEGYISQNNKTGEILTEFCLSIKDNDLHLNFIDGRFTLKHDFDDEDWNIDGKVY